MVASPTQDGALSLQSIGTDTRRIICSDQRIQTNERHHLGIGRTDGLSAKAISPTLERRQSRILLCTEHRRRQPTVIKLPDQRCPLTGCAPLLVCAAAAAVNPLPAPLPSCFVNEGRRVAGLEWRE